MIVALAPAMLGAALHAAAPSAQAPATVIHRCVGPDGAVALQDAPCPRGHRQDVRTFPAFAAPAGTTARASDTPAESPQGPATRVVESPGDAAAPPPTPTPPPIWRCTRPDGTQRLADRFDPQPRCVPLSMLGADLSRAPPAAALLCRTIEDDCVALGGDAACAAWRERLAAAESALRRAFSDTAAERRSERDRAKAVVDGDCRR